jgi:hypothetical protein
MISSSACGKCADTHAATPFVALEAAVRSCPESAPA